MARRKRVEVVRHIPWQGIAADPEAGGLVGIDMGARQVLFAKSSQVGFWDASGFDDRKKRKASILRAADFMCFRHRSVCHQTHYAIRCEESLAFPLNRIRENEEIMENGKTNPAKKRGRPRSRLELTVHGFILKIDGLPLNA